MSEDTQATPKVTLKVTWTFTYEADPKHYPECAGDPLKMAALDSQLIADGDIDLLALAADSETIDVIVEPSSGN